MSLKNICDCHVHCSFSGDSHEDPEDIIAWAIDTGIAGIIFTDHYDIDYPNKKYHFEFDLQSRARVIEQLKRAYGDKIEILNGIELGLQPHVSQASENIVIQGNFDFVIASIHAVDGYSLCSQSDFFWGKTKQEAYSRYLQEIYNGILNFDNFDIIGHIGYIRRYGPYQERSMKYVDYAEICDNILKAVIQKGKGIEINTSGYRYNLGGTIPSLDILQRYKQLGGEIITLGSDAHEKEQVADKFAQAIGILREVGFNYITYFKNRKPHFVKID